MLTRRGSTTAQVPRDMRIVEEQSARSFNTSITTTRVVKKRYLLREIQTDSKARPKLLKEEKGAEKEIAGAVSISSVSMQKVWNIPSPPISAGTPNADDLANMWQETPFELLERMFVWFHFNEPRRLQDFNTRVPDSPTRITFTERGGEDYDGVRIVVEEKESTPMPTPWHNWVSTELCWIFRRAFVETDRNDPKGRERMRRIFASFLEKKENGRAACSNRDERKLFADLGITASIRSAAEGPAATMTDSKQQRSRFGANLRLTAHHSCIGLREFFKFLFAHWSGGGDNGTRVLRKISVIPIKYDEKDRLEILAILQNKGTRGPWSYLERVRDTIGKERFERVAFGRPHVCGSCGATNREKWLLQCKQCEVEKLYPKKRYCDAVCQRIEWPIHREEHVKYGEMKETIEGNDCV